MTKIFNDWFANKIIHKDKILNFDFLNRKGFIKSIQDTEYYFLTESIDTVEYELYKYFNEKISNEMNIEDCNIEIKKFIKNLHVYNELKDIGQALVNKIAERKNTTSKEILKEMDYDFKN